jgi:Transposase
MTKSITVAERQTRDFAEKKYTVGLDLGDRWSWYCVLDEHGDVVFEHKLSTTPKALREVFGAIPHSRVALETGTHSPWVSRLMKELGHEVIVAQASKVRLIGESRKKDDRLDARTLARLARVDPELLGPIQHRSARAQADLIMIRARAGLVRARTALINAARGLTKSYGERLRGCSARNMDAEKSKGLSAELQMALEPLLRAIESLSQQILDYNERIEGSTLVTRRYLGVNRPNLFFGHCYALKISSIGLRNSFASLNARGRLGSYFSVSIAFTVWRETPSFTATSACVQFSCARKSRTEFFTGTSAMRTPVQIPKA